MSALARSLREDTPAPLAALVAWYGSPATGGKDSQGLVQGLAIDEDDNGKRLPEPLEGASVLTSGGVSGRTERSNAEGSTVRRLGEFPPNAELSKIELCGAQSEAKVRLSGEDSA